MPTLIYVEPDQEITELVDRVRGAGEDVVFIVPNRGNALQSALNMRVLRQYTRAFRRQVGIVSGDPVVQSLARDAGLPAYASLAAFERGVEVPAAAIAGGHPNAFSDGADVTPVPTLPGAPSRAPGAAPAPSAAAAARSGFTPPPSQPPPGRARGPAGRPSGVDRRPLYAIAAALFVIGLLLLFLVAPSARVTIVLAAQRVAVDNVPLSGTADPSQLTPQSVLTKVVTADETNTFQATAHGQKKLPATAAATLIVFQSSLVFKSAPPDNPVVPVCLPLSKNLVVAESGGPTGLKWVVTTPPPTDAACVGQPACASASCVSVVSPGNGTPGPASTPVTVAAVTAGAAGNVSANTVITVDRSIDPCVADTTDFSCQPSTDFRVANPAAATGGADATTETVVSQSDLDSWNQQVSQLTKTGQDQAQQDMKGKAPGYVFAIDPGRNGVRLSADLPSLPTVGDKFDGTKPFGVVVHGRAAMYDPNAVRAKVEALLRAAVQQRDAGATLCACGKVIADPTVQQAGDDGVVIFGVSGSGYSVPTVDYSSLGGKFAGHTRGSAEQQVRQQFGTRVEAVQFDQGIPFFVLPLFGSRIDVTVCVRSPDSPCGSS